jgi:sugar O-acyltransferase (sialic acid O-acetyltransferase NeuD family)
MEKLLIFPFNGNALEAMDCLGDNFELVGFIDDTISRQGDTAYGVKVYSREALTKFPDARILAVPGSAVSYPKRHEHIASLGVPPERFVSVIHPSARIGKNVSIGTNCLIMAGVAITSNAIIGDNVCILPNSVVHHDSVIKDYTLIGSNVAIAGGTTVGNNCYIGSGTNIINGISIGEFTLIGLGSNVVKPVPAHSTFAGNPAKEIKKQATAHGTQN